MPSFTIITDYDHQFVIVQYDDNTFGACNAAFFTDLTVEGKHPAWDSKSNNLLGKTYATQDEVLVKLAEVMGGLKTLGKDVSNHTNHLNPFYGQFTESDFPPPGFMAT